MSTNWENGISESEAAEQSRKYAGKVSEETVGEILEKEEKMKGFSGMSRCCKSMEPTCATSSPC